MLSGAGCRPSADDRVGCDQAGGRELEGQGRDVLFREVVGLAVLRTKWIGVDEVENLPEVDDKPFAPLTHEHPAAAASRDVDVVDMVVRVLIVDGRVVITERTVANPVHRLLERRAVYAADGHALTRTAVAAYEVERVGLEHIEVRRVVPAWADRPDIDQWNSDVTVPHRQGDVFRLSERERLLNIYQYSLQ